MKKSVSEVSGGEIDVPLISVIVPVYNVRKYLARCLDSVIGQTYKNLEIILVNDGSDDGSDEICKEFEKKDPRIKFFTTKNRGLSAARNYGISKCHGKFVGFVDSDDWITSEMYSDLLKLLVMRHADIAVGGIKKVPEGASLRNEELNGNIKVLTRDEYMKLFFKVKTQRIEYYANNKLYRRELLGNDQYPVGLTSEDVFGTYKAILNSKKIVLIDKIYYYYFQREDSITGHFSEQDYDLLKVWDLVVDYSKRNAPEYLEYARINRYRSDFTLLYRLSKEFSVKELKLMPYVEELRDALRKHEKILIKAPIVFNRKVMIFLYTHCFWLMCLVVRLV